MTIGKLLKVNWHKTIIYNFSLFPFATAVKMPVLLFGKVCTKGTKRGSIEFACKPYTGMLRIGYVSVSWADSSKRTVYQVMGKHVVHGDCAFGAGSVIVVTENATLDTGSRVWFNEDTKIHCREKITIGDRCLFAWECQIMDTDFHYLIKDGIISKNCRPIEISYGTWIGNRVSINKGVFIPPMSVVSSNSVVSKDFADVGSEILLAGMPAKIIRKDCKRAFPKSVGGVKSYDKLLDKLFREHNVGGFSVEAEVLKELEEFDSFA